jgi:hypothetical protein
MNRTDKKNVHLFKKRNHIKDKINNGKNRYEPGNQMEIIGFPPPVIIKKDKIARNKKNIGK